MHRSSPDLAEGAKAPPVTRKQARRRAPVLVDDPRSDTAYCRAMIRTGSRSFFIASHLLPSGLRGAAYALYGFCREADDAIDGGADPFIALALFRERLATIYGDGPIDGAVDRALARVVRDYALPRELLEALLQGFAWDAQARSYKDLAGVYNYSVRVAGSVGIMMAVLMGVRDRDLLARAADLGVAMQLTNIARDVGEDARRGRVYLPLRWLREVDLSPQILVGDPRFSPELGQVVSRLLSAAECLYQRADSGIARLPARCRPGIYAARLLYAGIGHELLRRDADSVARRTVVPSWRKIGLTARALLPPPVTRAHLLAEPLPQVRYLIRAVDEQELPEERSVESDGLSGDLEWVMKVIGELEQRDRRQHGGGPLRNGSGASFGASMNAR
ncbi:MAG: phytoene/squalene synthase family protein [Halieaceae bacterium]|jgi:phytoene synthase|nr:phytoene/squalene synthase family protein [Halieaceae bacterium]